MTADRDCLKKITTDITEPPAIDITEDVKAARQWIDSQGISQRRISTKKSTVALENVLAVYACHVTDSRGDAPLELEREWRLKAESLVASLTKERDELQQKLEVFTDWDKEPDALLGELKYIADSPAPEHGGFHERVTAAARGAVSGITSLRARVESLTQQLREIRQLLPPDKIAMYRGWHIGGVMAEIDGIARKALQEGNNAN